MVAAGGAVRASSGVATLVSLICGDWHPKTSVSSHGPLSNIERGHQGWVLIAPSRSVVCAMPGRLGVGSPAAERAPGLRGPPLPLTRPRRRPHGPAGAHTAPPPPTRPPPPPTRPRRRPHGRAAAHTRPRRRPTHPMVLISTNSPHLESPRPPKRLSGAYPRRVGRAPAVCRDKHAREFHLRPLGRRDPPSTHRDPPTPPPTPPPRGQSSRHRAPGPLPRPPFDQRHGSAEPEPRTRRTRRTRPTRPARPPRAARPSAPPRPAPPTYGC